MKTFHFLAILLFIAPLNYANTSLAQGLLVKYNNNYHLHTAADTRSIKFENEHLYVINDSTQADYSREQIEMISFYEMDITFKETTVREITSSSAFLRANITDRVNGKVGFQISTYPEFEEEVTQEILAEGNSTGIYLKELENGTKYYFRPFLSFENTIIYGNTQSFTTNCVCKLTEHEYVDLGLPSGTLWAAYNVGSRNWSPGYHYYYGETESKTYSSNYKELPLSNDVAQELWGGNWRMPTANDIYELICNCSCSSTTYGNYSGFLVTGKNGNSIFIPKSGFYHNNTKMQEYSVYLWSSTLYDNTSAYYLNIDGSNMQRYTFVRSNEMYVRPVIRRE